MKNLFLLMIILLLVGCSPQRRLTRIVKKHPELITTKIEVKSDTIKIPEIKEITKFEFIRDTLALDSLLALYSELKRSEEFVIGTDRIIAVEKALQRIRREITKKAIPDTTFRIKLLRTVVIKDSSYVNESYVTIHISETGVTHSFESSPIIIPYESEITTQIIDTSRSVKYYAGWVLRISVIILMIILLWWIRREVLKFL